MRPVYSSDKTGRIYEIARNKFYQVISPEEPVSAFTKGCHYGLSSLNEPHLDHVTTNGYYQRVKTIVQFGID